MYAEPGWARIAALAPLVVTCAEQGDLSAKQILEQGCQDLVMAVQAVAGRLQMTQTFRLVLAGALLHHPCLHTWMHLLIGVEL